MLGPSGFFLAAEPENQHTYSNDMEILHSSDEGFSQLYRVCKNGRFFVYKALKEEYRGNLLYEELLDKDFNIGFSLSHICICQYFAKISHPVIGSCIVMEWIDGCTLEDLLKSGKADRVLCQKIICEICDAIDYIHRKQIIHRDLKPENILVTYNGQNVKIIDFGLSDADSYNTFKSPAGTRHYASPELLAGEQADARSDIWSLGVIINEIDRRYHHVASRCLQQDKTKRYGCAADVKKDILKAGARSLARTAILIAAAVIAALAIFLAAVRDEETPKASQTGQHPASEQTVIAAPTQGTQAQEDPKAISKADNSAKQTVQPTAIIEKPATQSYKVQPADNIDAEEFDQLFHDAMRSIL